MGSPDLTLTEQQQQKSRCQSLYQLSFPVSYFPHNFSPHSHQWPLVTLNLIQTTPMSAWILTPVLDIVLEPVGVCQDVERPDVTSDMELSTFHTHSKSILWSNCEGQTGSW